MDRVSLRTLMAVQAGTAALLGAGMVWGSLSLMGPQRGSAPGPAEIARVSKAFAGALDRGLNDVRQDLRTAALALRQTGSGLTDSDPQALLRAWADLRPGYTDLLLVGANGRIKAAGREETVGHDVSGQTWFNRAKGNPSAIVTASATPRDPVPFEVSIPVASGPGSRTVDYLVARLSDVWLADIRDELLRARAASDSTLALTVLAPDGRALVGTGGPQAGAGRALEHATPSAGYGDLGASGWLAVARAPEPRGGGIGLPDGRLGALWLAAALLAAGAAYGLTGRLTRRLSRITEADGGEAAPSRIAEFREGAERLVARERSRGRALQESRTALARVRERLRTFEAMSGWTYWEIDTDAGNVTWVDSSVPGVAASADRAVALTDLTDGIDPQDRDLMQFTMQAALDGNGPHDVILRRAGSAEGQEARRLLVRFIRAEAADAVTRLHALSREVPAGQKTAEAGGRDGTTNAAAQDHAPERRGEGMLRQILDGVVDDFNNLLTVISGNLGTLKRRHRLDPEQSRLIDAALAGAQRGSSLTRRLVRFARRDESALQETEVGAALAAFVPFLGANVLHQTNIKVRVRPGLARALCSEAMLEAVLLNLAFHVRDIGSEGFAIGADERVLTDEDGIALRPGRYVRLVLASGTPARATLEANPAGAERSTAAVASLLSAVGGGFRLLADGGGETAFLAEIWIPASEAAAEAGDCDLAAPQPRLRVLLVDSDTLVRESFAEALTDLGHRVTQAGSAEHALALLDAPDGYDVMIADQRMPVMGGLQLAATVVQHHPDIRIVLAGPQGHMPESARAFLQIDKPFRYGDLAAVMRRAAADPAARAA